MSAVNEPKSSSALSTYSCYRLRYLYRRRRILIICFVATIVIYVIFAHPARQTTQASDDGYMGGCYRIEMGACLNDDRLQDTESQQPAFQNDDILSNTVQKVLKTILPGEMEAHKLLETIHGSGKERLHELGLRTRAFKQLFDVWEALHLVSVENSLYIRDDVIQRLQGRESRLHSSQSTLAETVRCYEAFRSLVQNLGRLLFPWSAPYFADHMILHTQFYRPGRGIVLTAGNDQIIYLITSVKLIRKLGCRLPIEIMYLGEGDLNKDNRRRLERLPGVITRDIRRMVDDKGWQLRGWAGKPYAILLSSFREVIFIDADALFFQNPEVLFEDNSYIETGALFFHDRLMMKESKKSWLQETLPKPISAKAKQSRLWTGQSAHMQESGVVVVDKWKHFISLLLVMRMNGPDRDGNEGKGIVGVYDMLYGDKETFWIGWELAGDLNYSFHEGPTGAMGMIHSQDWRGGDENLQKPLSITEEVQICAPQLLHMAYDGSPLWFNGWILENKFEQENAKFQNFECYMREPREITDPEAWTMGQSNKCCLSGLQTFEFTKEEKQTLKTIFQFAVDAGASSSNIK